MLLQQMLYFRAREAREQQVPGVQHEGINRQVAITVLTVTILHVALLAEFVRKNHWDLSATVQASAARAKSSEYSAISRPLPTGHDGQFYYLIAQNPFAPAPRELLDTPARHTRMLYPLLGWLASGGGYPRVLIFSLPFINLLAVVGLGWLGARWAVSHGRSAYAGLFLVCALVPGISLVHDLTDAVAALAMVSLIFAYIEGFEISLGPLALATLLAKEQNAAIVGLVIVSALCARRWKASMTLSIATLAWIGWIYWVWQAYGEKPFLPIDGNFSLPFYGLHWRLTHLGQVVGTEPVAARRLVFQLLSTVYLIVVATVSAWLALRPGALLYRGLAAGGALLIFTAGPGIYAGIYDYTRVLVLAPFAVWLAGVASGRNWMVCMVLPGALWAYYTGEGWF